MKKKTKIIWIVIIAVGIAGGLFWYATRKPAAVYVTEPVSRTTVAQTVSVTGELIPEVYADLSFGGLGTVKKVFVSRGDTVMKGQVIAMVDTSVLFSQMESANIALSIAVQNEQLARRGRVTAWKRLAPEEREAKIFASEQARKSVQTIKTQIAQGTIVSPIDGVVTKLDVREGETAIAGKVIGRISKGNGLVLEARVPEADIEKLKLDMSADVTFDALTKDDILHATVYEIEPSSTVVQDVVSYVTRFRLNDADVRLKEGMSATIDTVTAKSENVLAVPFRAILHEGVKNFVELSTDAIQVTKREVTIGLEGDDGMIEVGRGVSEGDLVVTSKVK